MARTRLYTWCLGPALVLLLATGCGIPGFPATGPDPASSVVDAAPPVPSATASRADLPTRTAVPSVAVTATATKTVRLSVTPTATPSPSPTATPCAEAAGHVESGTFPSPIQDIDQRYRIYLPPCYQGSDRLYPALYLFHGNIYTESQWDSLGIDEAADDGISAGVLPPFIIVMPFGGDIANTTSGGDWSFEGVFLQELVPTVEEKYCVWTEPAGRAIGGLSRGGYWSLEIGFRHPELFAAVGGHSAAIFADSPGAEYNPLTTGADPGVIGLPIYLDIGEDDWLLQEGILDLHDVMVEAGVPHTWLVNPGAHTDGYWSEHASQYLAWYASHWPSSPLEYPSAGTRICSLSDSSD